MVYWVTAETLKSAPDNTELETLLNAPDNIKLETSLNVLEY